MAGASPTRNESTQSFVVRIWQEAPGDLHGTIRHVQSQAQFGFTRLSQAQSFIEQQLIPSAPPAQTPTPRVFQFPILNQRRFRLAMAAVAMVAFAAIVVLINLSTPNLPGSALVASASGQGGPAEIITAFLIGLGLGGLGIYFWSRQASRLH